MITEIRKNDVVLKYFLISILLNLVPIIIASSFISEFEKSILYQLLVGCMFLFQLTLLGLYYYQKRMFLISKGIALLSVVFLENQIFTSLGNLIKKIDINPLDFINTISRFFSFFILFCIPYTYSISKKTFMKFMQAIVYLGIIASIYNIIINISGILNLGSITNSYAVNFSSFYLNRNSFAQLLFVSYIANTYLLLENKKITSNIIFFIFIFNILITFSRTVCISTIVFTIFINLFMFKKKIFTIFFSLVGVILLLVFLFSNESILNFISTMLIRKTQGTSGRIDLWIIAIDVLNKTNWFFGCGYRTCLSYMWELGYSQGEFHSFYIETLVGGGLIDLIFLVYIFKLILAKVNLVYRYDRNIGAVMYSSYIALCLYALTESVSFFTMGYVGNFFTIFFVTVPIMYGNSFQHKVNDDNQFIFRA